MINLSCEPPDANSAKVSETWHISLEPIRSAGCLPQLRQAYQTNTGRYTRWIALFDQHPEPVYLIYLYAGNIYEIPQLHHQTFARLLG
jgi:hypothetical protein